MKPVWIWRNHAPRIYEVDSHIVTPIVRSIGAHWRGDQGAVGWLWHFPVAIEVEDRVTGTQTRLPISDPTRIVVWFLVALAVAVLFIASLTRWRNARSKKGNR